MFLSLAHARRSASPRGLALALLLMAGCRGDADRGRIASGTVASVHGEAGQSAPVFVREKTERLAAGSRVMVVADREADPGRKVVVSIQAGPWRGMAAQMYRSDLRP
jgi:hypothetical protein